MPNHSASSDRLATWRLIVVPSVITLAVTLLRLLGELEHWSKTFFNPTAGGGFAIIGITWLPIIFGPYFAVKLVKAGEGPASAWKPIVVAILGAILFVGGLTIAASPKLAFPAKQPVGLAIAAVGALIQFNAWGKLAQTLLAYAYAARIPVAIIMYFAMRGNWGTHYDAMGPEFAGLTTFWSKYLEAALIPQLVDWIIYTVVLGALVGSIAAVIARRGKPAVQPA